MKVIRILGVIGFLGGVAALSACSGDNGRATAAAADITTPVGGSSWTQLVEVLDCKLFPANPAPNPSTAVDNNNVVTPAPAAASCPGGMKMFLLSKDGTFKLSDGSNGNLTADELKKVNDMLGGITATDLAQPLTCHQLSATNNVNNVPLMEHSSFIQLGDDRILTLSSMHTSTVVNNGVSSEVTSSCSLGSGDRSVDIHTTLFPIIQAHLVAPAPTPAPAPAPNPAPAPVTPANPNPGGNR